MKKKTSSPKTAESGKLKKALSCWQLYILLIPALIWLIVFAYYPMYGLIIAFKDFKGRMGIMGSPWADPIFKYFKMFFSTSIAMTAIKNTIIISLESLIIGFPIPVILALMMNEMKNMAFKKVSQTLLYLPHFISWVILSGIIMTLLDPDNGMITNLIQTLTRQHIMVLTDSRYFVPMLIITDIYKGLGWGTIIYFAAISGIDPSLYEAAAIDGAGKWKTFFYITLPNLRPVAFTVVILSVLNSFKAFREVYMAAGSYPQENIYLLQHVFNNWFQTLSVDKMAAASVMLAFVIAVFVLLLERSWEREG